MSRECTYYRWNSGYYCDLKYDKQGNGDIGDYEVKHYCWDGKEENCPLYKDQNSSSGCFLTSACVEARGLPDDCDELQTLRYFRDSYMKQLPCGECEISHYYAIAPMIVYSINRMSNHQDIWMHIYDELIVPCVNWIKSGEYDNAYFAYKSTVLELMKNFGLEEVK